MKEFWSYSILKEWKRNIYKSCLTHDDYLGNAQAEFYDNVIKINADGIAVPVEVEPENLRKVVRMKKDNQKYMLPLEFETQLPLMVTEYFECQLKPSDKTIYRFVTKGKSMNIPTDNLNKSFKEFVHDFNPVDHESPDDWTFLRLLTIASKYKSVKCCVCSPPSTGKNANFMVVHHILDKCPRLSGPTPARMYQAIVNNDVVIIDELTSVKSELVREIEGMVLQVGDNSTEYIKHSQTVGRQLKEADLVKKSIIFTYNRITDIGPRSTFFDDKWNNAAAFKSRFPQFLLKGKVIGDAPVYSYYEIQKKLELYDEKIKAQAKQLSYWTKNIAKHLHHWNHTKLQVKGRHKSNLSGLIDVIDCYAESQDEFDAWAEFINESLSAYKRMLKGEQDVETKIRVTTAKYNKETKTFEDVDEEIL